MRLTAKQRRVVVETARSYLGVPWRHQGRTRRGIDCLGLVALSIGAVRPVVDRQGYGRTPYNAQLRASLVEHFGEPVSKDAMRPADVVTIRWTGEEHHVGIIGDHPDGLSLIHAYSVGTGGKVIEHRLDAHWLDLVHEVFRP